MLYAMRKRIQIQGKGCFLPCETALKYRAKHALRHAKPHSNTGQIMLMPCETALKYRAKNALRHAKPHSNTGQRMHYAMRNRTQKQGEGCFTPCIERLIWKFCLLTTDYSTEDTLKDLKDFLPFNSNM